ncbi:MAG: VWA domain-containing protein [Planctomycetia bacterium]|nr:VWA domain-containing protein [Planctomycetia bacterium]
MNRLVFFKQQHSGRRGVILVLTAVVLIVMLGFVAFTVDIGLIQLTKTQLQAAADAGALAGAMELSGTLDAATVRTNARTAAVDVAKLYRNGDQNAVTLDPINDITFGKIAWNATTQTYQYTWGDSAVPYSVIKVRAMRSTSGGDSRLPLVFAPILGTQKASIEATAVATFQPRDIMVVLDFSASMNDDSSLGAIGKLGRSYIESNLQTMWNELGAPVYGNLTFTPKHAKLAGRAASGTIPHIDVTFKRTSIDVVSTSNLSQVRLQFSSGSTQTFTGLTAKTGTFAGTSGNSNKDITSCWVKSGTNGSLSSGNLGEQFDFTASNIQTALGLTGSYPYPSGSWSDYISKVQSSSGDIANAGYRDMYGYLTWIHYLEYNYPMVTQTPDLWKTSEQPVGVMKDAVDLFIDYLTTVEAQDYIGLSVFTHTNSAGAILEHGLSNNINQIKTTTRQRQAGHYTGNTNISAGMKVARDELNAHARPRSFKMMIVLTDGVANLPSSESVGTAAVISEANAAKGDKIKILSICLGAGADTATLQQVADITGGVFYNVPPAASISSVQTQLQNVFREIASSRPLKLVSGQ